MFARPDRVDPLKVAAYIRWSTDEQGQGTTLEVQRERVGLFIRSQGWDLREELVFIDDGYSGGTLDRPAMRRLREAVQAGQVDCVVVYKLDRLSRSLLDTVTLVRQEWQGRCTLCSATENFDTYSPVGQMVFNILVSFAEFERNLIRERTLSGKRKRAQQGKNAGQRYPYGYRRAADGGWALDGQDPATGGFTGPAAVVRRIFEVFLAGAGMPAVARALNREGTPSPGGAAWRAPYVGRILANPAYAGTYRYGADAVAGAVPPIVSDAEFAAAERLRRQRAACRTKAAADAYLLSGIARCARCGSAVAGSRGKGRRYYVCTGRTLLHRCDCAYLEADGLEAAVLAAVRAACPLRVDGSQVQAALAQAVAQREAAVAAAAACAARADQRRRRLEDRLLRASLDPGAFAGLAGRAGEEQERAAERLRRAEAALAEARAAAGAAVAPLPDPWAALGTAERRQILRDLLAGLLVYRPKAATGGRRIISPQPEISLRPRFIPTPDPPAPATPDPPAPAGQITWLPALPDPEATRRALRALTAALLPGQTG